MGNDAAAANIERLNAEIALNDEFRDEAKKTIDDIISARTQSERAGEIADKLALGTLEAAEEVVELATPALEEFRVALADADAAFNALFESGQLLEAKINSMNNKTELSSKEIETLEKYNLDIQKTSIKLFAAGDKVAGISSALSTVENSLAQA